LGFVPGIKIGLYLTVLFGLRPKEVDHLKDNALWRVETLTNGRKVLWVFQTKLIALPPQDPWKPIPLLYDEQHFALNFIYKGIFKRPLIKTMKRYFDPGIDLYGGRKGFTDLMLSRGQSIENISIWMGHSTLDRTWRTYKDRRRYHLNY
jgi:integrase